MRRRSLVAVTALALPLLACTPSSEPADSELPLIQEASYDVEGACSEFSDVLTVVANGKAGLDTGRMEEQERDGWFHLATSMLERLPVEADHPVAEATATLQAVAPHDPGWFEPTTVDTAEWHEASMEVYRACEEAGHVAPTRIFTGG